MKTENYLNEVLIKERIRKNIESIDHINVLNFSQQHSGHKDATDNSHFHISLVSSCFINLNRLERHKKIMKLFHEELSDNTIHALSLTLCTPSEYKEINKDSRIEEE